MIFLQNLRQSNYPDLKVATTLHFILQISYSVVVQDDFQIFLFDAFWVHPHLFQRFGLVLYGDVFSRNVEDVSRKRPISMALSW